MRKKLAGAKNFLADIRNHSVREIAETTLLYIWAFVLLGGVIAGAIWFYNDTGRSNFLNGIEELLLAGLFLFLLYLLVLGFIEFLRQVSKWQATKRLRKENAKRFAPEMERRKKVANERRDVETR